MGKGGARHTPKPQVDVGLLMKVFSRHLKVLKDLGPYEAVSKNQACNPAGLMHVLDMVKDLVDLEQTCEIHQSSIRSAVFQVLLADPALNDTKYNGWASFCALKWNG